MRGSRQPRRPQPTSHPEQSGGQQPWIVNDRSRPGHAQTNPCDRRLELVRVVRQAEGKRRHPDGRRRPQQWIGDIARVVERDRRHSTWLEHACKFSQRGVELRNGLEVVERRVRRCRRSAGRALPARRGTLPGPSLHQRDRSSTGCGPRAASTARPGEDSPRACARTVPRRGSDRPAARRGDPPGDVREPAAVPRLRTIPCGQTHRAPRTHLTRRRRSQCT
jgi:hypothetical protein